MRKLITALLSVLLSLVFVPPASASGDFEVRWSDTQEDAYIRVFLKSKYWNSEKNAPRKLPDLVVTIDLATYQSGRIVHEVASNGEYQVETSYDLASVFAEKGAVVVQLVFPEWVDCGGTKPKFCAGEWSERIRLYDKDGYPVLGQQLFITRKIDPPKFKLSVSGGLSANLGSYYSATVKLTGPKAVKVSCRASLYKQSTALFPPIIASQNFVATVNRPRVIRFAILEYSTVPQRILVKCGEKYDRVTFAVRN